MLMAGGSLVCGAIPQFSAAQDKSRSAWLCSYLREQRKPYETCSINALYCKFKSDLKSQRRNLMVIDCNLFGYCFCSRVPGVRSGGDWQCCPWVPWWQGLWPSLTEDCEARLWPVQGMMWLWTSLLCPWEKGEQGSCLCSPCSCT